VAGGAPHSREARRSGVHERSPSALPHPFFRAPDTRMLSKPRTTAPGTLSRAFCAKPSVPTWSSVDGAVVGWPHPWRALDSHPGV